MSFPTALEQLFLELVNQARADPAGELARFNALNDSLLPGRQDMGNLNEGLSAGRISADPKQPLAFIPTLGDAARGHSSDMLRQSYFAHQGLDGRSPSERGFAAGWDRGASGWTFGENIAFSGSTAPGYAERVETLIAHHLGLFQSSGHRVNLMNPDFSETGVGQAMGAYTINGATYGSSSLFTQKFADAGRTYITGVVIDDRDGDRFYDIGEGRGGIEIVATGAAGAVATATWDAGGYTLQVAPGTYTVTFSGTALASPVVRTVTVGADNVKVDVRVQDAGAPTIGDGGQTPGTGVPVAGDGTLRLLPGMERVAGTVGLDTLVVDAGRGAIVVDVQPDGSVTVAVGGAAPVVLTSVERVRLDDGTVAFDVDGAAGKAYRLYEAAFDRTPDEGGLGFWIGVFDAGASIQAVAAAFVGSAEFASLYGQVDDAGFVDLLYRNILDRAGEAGGTAYWISELADGMSRGDVLASFSDGTENRARTADAIADGIWYV
ncbi:DUF4214 domain-containing protein [Salinarimonas ramus]|uniref:DUF4214 domain-containing protein n=1 Tax=Salinarimonas ramus TaxID=690164 RepID=A0A917QEK0_9HYPH|nr:DUF4214 domain-containing protein [Salinarimonas ramus]GGK46836.1 hypothetical protein GCM10011322_37430 [Salinarimonas ramus]